MFDIKMRTKELKEIVSSWALKLDFRVRIYFYGSQVKGTQKTGSDYDLAIEFMDPFINTTITWMDYHDIWQNQLTEASGVAVHLELLDDDNENVKKYVNEESIIIFESPEEELKELEDDDLKSLSIEEYLKSKKKISE